MIVYCYCKTRPLKILTVHVRDTPEQDVSLGSLFLVTMVFILVVFCQMLNTQHLILSVCPGLILIMLISNCFYWCFPFFMHFRSLPWYQNLIIQPIVRQDLKQTCISVVWVITALAGSKSPGHWDWATSSRLCNSNHSPGRSPRLVHIYVYLYTAVVI